MGRVAELVEAVLEEGSFDTSEDRVLKWLSRRQRLMCSRSRCYRKKLELGPTVAGQQAYAVPAEALEIREVQVAGVLWGAGRHSDLPQGAQGWLWLERLLGSGITTREDSSAGDSLLALYPIPSEAGLTITAYTVCEPPDLKAGDDTTLVVPPTMDEALINAAMATGLLRLEARPDLAAPLEAAFGASCEELARSTARRFRGTGPAQIRVVGFNA